MGSKTFLIIGGSGFIGKSILKYFLVKSHLKKKFSKIIIISRNGLNNNRLKNELKKNYKFVEIKADILRLKKMPFADYVVYSALIKNSKKDYLALKNYINLAKLHHRKSNIIYLSSGAVDIFKNYKFDSFNKSHKNFFYSHKTFNFKKNYKKSYGYLKYLNEKQFQELGDLGMNISIARCFTFVGEFLPLNSYFIIGNFIQNILRRENIKILSNYTLYRSYMHTNDLVKWLLKILYNSNTKCPIYNVGSDDKISMHKLATFLAKKYKLNVTASKILSKKIDCYVPNISKTKKLLNLNIKYKSIQAVIKTINAHSKINKNIF
jgi:dTDP-glucose 4,6-dehydratase